MSATNFATGGPKAAARSASATGNAVNSGEREDLANFIWERTNLDREWCSNLAKAILERFRQDVEPLTHGTYDPDDDSTKTPERGYP